VTRDLQLAGEQESMLKTSPFTYNVDSLAYRKVVFERSKSDQGSVNATIESPSGSSEIFGCPPAAITRYCLPLEIPR
jgi:hypothetical protein